MMDFLLPHHINLTLIVAAGLGLLVGLALWIRGYRFARTVLTVLLASAGAFWGYIAPHYWHNAPVAIVCSVLLGVTGAILGFVGFRLMQAIMVCLLATGLVAGVMAHNAGAFNQPPPPQTQPSQENLAAHALVKTQPNSADQVWKFWQRAYEAVQYKQRQYASLPASERAAIRRAAVAVGIVVLTLGLIFAKPCSLISTSWIGALMALWSLDVLASWLKPGSPGLVFKHVPEAQLIVAAGVLGTLVQLTQLWLGGRKAKKKTSDEKKA